MSSPPALRYRPDLDGLRSVAVYLVVAFHAHVALVDGGFVGVDLFFVLSGFLVTGVLLRDVGGEGGEEGRVRLGRFYARRVRRLLPAALVVIASTAALQLLVLSLPARLELVDDARASVLYVANWHFVAESRDYFAQDDAASPFLHFWSLSIEEQFYIVYPVLVLAVARWARRPVRTLAVLLAGVAAASVVAQVWTNAADPNLAYYATHTRVYQLAAGGLLMILLLARDGRARTTPAGSPRSTAAWAAVAVVGLGLVLVTASSTAGSVADVDASARGLLATVGATATVAGLWCAPRGPLARVLALPLPRYLGQVSYGTYLWHWPVTLVVQRVFDTAPVVDALLTAVVATGLAALSYHALELPVRTAKPLHRVPWPVVGAGLTTSLLLVVAVLPAVLERDARPAVTSADRATTAAVSDALRRPVPADLDLVAAQRDYGEDTATPCVADDPSACTTVDGVGDGPHVLLVGDSQANMFIPAFETLARERGWRLSVQVRVGCPWQADQVNVRGDATADGEAATACTAMRDDFYADVLPLMDVDLVVAVGLSRSDAAWEGELTSVSPRPAGETLAGLQDRTTRVTAATITGAGPGLVVVHSLFGTDGYGLGGFDPIECLAAADVLADCAVVPPPRQPAVDDVYGALAIESDQVETIDLARTICPGYPVCAPVVGRTVVWKDRDHVTATFLTERRDAIYRKLVRTGLLPTG